jgi:tripartite-type tricarboxylate transporter receptor subunit TctC
VKNVQQLIALGKASPGKLMMANAGTGFQSHLAGVMFTHSTGTDIRHVPYKGGASLIAVISNESQLTIAPAPSVISHVRAGRLRALGSGGEKRSTLLPDLPAINETVPGFVSTGWTGLMAPKRTPKTILEKLHSTLADVLSDPSTRELLERQGGEPWITSPADMVSFIKAEYARFGEAIRLADLKPQ